MTQDIQGICADQISISPKFILSYFMNWIYRKGGGTVFVLIFSEKKHTALSYSYILPSVLFFLNPFSLYPPLPLPPPAAPQGETLQMEVGVSLEEVFQGASKTLRYQRNTRCRPCSGAGPPLAPEGRGMAGRRGAWADSAQSGSGFLFTTVGP